MSFGRRDVAAAGAAYLALSLLLNLPVWIGGLSDKAQNFGGGDVAIYVWGLRWTPYALLHGHNLFHSNWLNYPGGVNLLDNNSCLLLGLLATPVTLAFGPVASFNLLETVAFAASALGAYLLLRRWTGRATAAFVGAAVYGFSPYMISEGWGHLQAIFIPLPPLIVLCLDELIVRQRGSRVRWGIGLGLLIAAQFFISSEVLADTAELSLVGIILLALLHRRQAREKFRHAAVGLGVALAVGVGLLAYPVWYAVFGPEHGGLPATPVAPFVSADLLSPVIPTSNQLLATPGLSHVGDMYSGGAIPWAGLSHVVTNGSYLGLPLVLIALYTSIRWRAEPLVRFIAVMTLVAFIACLGPSLKVAGHITGVAMPLRLLYHLPLLSAAWPYRYGSYLALGAGTLLALGLSLGRRRAGAKVTAVLAAASLLPLLPAAPYPIQTLIAPAYFRSSAVSTLPQGTVVATYPPPTAFTSVTMTWQAIASMRYRMIGGYILARDREGRVSAMPDHGYLETYLLDIWSGRASTAAPQGVEQAARRELEADHVSTALVAMQEPNSRIAVSFFASLLRTPPRYLHGVAVFARANVQRASTALRAR